LEQARDALAAVAGVTTCKVGREANISPNSYPLIRIVPIRTLGGKGYAGRTGDSWVFFGAALTNADGLEAVYSAMSAMEKDIIDVLGTIEGRYIETLNDQDQLDQDQREPYKLMAIRCELTAPATPHVKCAIYSASTAETLGASPTVVAPFTNNLHNSSALDWTPTLASGSIERLLNGAASIRTRVTIEGFVAGAAASEVSIGIYAAGTLVGNRTQVVTSGAGAPIAFEVGATHTAAIGTAYDVRATGTAGTFTFTGLTLTAQRV
jgi:hypothetical protein